MNKRIFKYIIISFMCSLFVSIAYFFTDIQTSIIRNGEEYVDIFLDGQVFEQEIYIKNTNKLSINVMTVYNSPDENIGVKYTILQKDGGNVVSEGFINLSDLLNNSWTSIKIKTNDILYEGVIKLKLEAVGLTSENSLSFLIVTNNLQENLKAKLYKDGQIIENGRLQMAYKELKITQSIKFCLIFSLIIFVICIFNKKIIMNIKKYPVVYIAGLFLFFAFMKNYDTFTQKFNPHVTTQYFFNWFDLGVVKRAFLGTIIELLNIDFNAKSYIIYSVICIIILLILQLYIINSKDFVKERYMLNKYYILFLCMPFGVFAFFQPSFFGRLDQVLIICFLLSCLCIIKEKALFLIPVFSVIAIMIHEMYLLMFIPFIFCLLLYKWYFDKNKRYLLCLTSTSVISVIFGILFGVILKTSTQFDAFYGNVVEKARPDFILEFAVRANYFMSKKAVFEDNFNIIFTEQTIPLTIYSLLFLIPVIILCLKWFEQYFKIQKDKIGKFIVCIFPLTLGGFFLSMYLMCDWGRLFVMYGFCVFFSFITLLKIDTKNVKICINNVLFKIDRNLKCFLFVSLCIFYLILTLNNSSSTTLFDIGQMFI